MSKDQKHTFEEAMEHLERIVERLEEGEVPLEEAITIYQKGMEFSKLCHEKLKQAEEKMVNVMTEEGEIKPFSVEEDSR